MGSRYEKEVADAQSKGAKDGADNKYDEPYGSHSAFCDIVSFGVASIGKPSSEEQTAINKAYRDSWEESYKKR